MIRSPEETRRITLAIVDAQAELSKLAAKSRLNKQEARQFDQLLSRVASLKAGIPLEDIMYSEANSLFRESGLPEVRPNRSKLTPEQRAHNQAWCNYIKTGAVETRDGELGTVALSYMQGSGGGLVPVEFLADVFSAMRQTDPLFDPAAVTYRETRHGRPIQVGTLGDIEEIAVPISEGSSASQVDIAKPGAVMIGAYSFRSPMYKLSLEAFEDVESAGGAIELFKTFAASRISRGVGKLLVNGNGSGQTLGLVNALLAAGITPTVAAGSSGNTGGSESGATSIGSADIAKLYFSVDASYRASPKCGFLMNDNTLTYLASIVTKQGIPLVNWVDGTDAFILGKPVFVSPSMNSIGASNYPVVFGDCSYWMTRCAVDATTRVMLFKESPGLIENGEVGLRMFARYDGALLWNDTGSPAPFGVLQNHS
jgi:HK97 family phage major capsid protein